MSISLFEKAFDLDPAEKTLLWSKDHDYFSELVEALQDQVGCRNDNTFLSEYGDTAILSLIFFFILLGFVKYCHFQFSQTEINKLTLRPLLWALLSLMMAAMRTIIHEITEAEEKILQPKRFLVAIDRLAKVSAMVLGMSINFEKEVLNMFMIFQQAYKQDEFSVAREDYRRLEKKTYKIYQIELIVVACISFIITILTCLPFSNFVSNWVESILDMILLFLNATVVRSAISQNVTFFHKLYIKHRFEFNKHVRHEFLKQVLLLLSYCLLDVVGIYTLFCDSITVGCTAWVRRFGVLSFIV